TACAFACDGSRKSEPPVTEIADSKMIFLNEDGPTPHLLNRNGRTLPDRTPIDRWNRHGARKSWPIVANLHLNRTDESLSATSHLCPRHGHFLAFLAQIPARSFTRSLWRLVPVLRKRLCRCVFTVACETPSISAIAFTPLALSTASSTRTSLAVSL